MKKIQFTFYKTHGTYFLAVIVLLLSASCKKQLDVKDPNDPTFAGNVNSESGMAAYAKGGIYWNGFNYGDGWLGDSYFSLPWGYHELMGDVVGGGQGSNNQTTTMGVPDKFQADPTDASTVFTNTSPQALGIIRGFNTTAASANANNALYYEWVNMYSMINSCNLTLENLGGITLTADKANTIKAWCYWWKGYAYAQIGTMYYAGLVVDHSNTVVSKFVNQAAIITESNKQLNLAMATLSAISNQADYHHDYSADTHPEPGGPWKSVVFCTMDKNHQYHAGAQHCVKPSQPFCKQKPCCNYCKSYHPCNDSGRLAICYYTLHQRYQAG